ncbi:septum site-determining protein Ssd [Cellulomonas sp. SG140]|uniref:septum site-determining protein Ssd n=1 Tax=Cellulomonas sp. SG140 TaxID=2976536 RepID=UPI0021E79F4C|nr:septum site-determining protein Ssd [Cellulomonas sp. SG140]
MSSSRVLLPPGPGAAATGAGPAPRAAVVGVVGARGGAGTSTLAALTAARLARRTSTVLVDLDPGGGGLDVTVGVEDADGARWPELAGARGDVPGEDVLALLPRWGACAVLSADRDGSEPEPGLVADVLQALAGAVGAIVLDLPRGGASGGAAVLGACDVVVVVARRDLRSVAGTLAVRPRLVAAGASVGLVVLGRGPGGLSVAELSAAVDLPVLWAGGTTRRLARAAERGALPSRGTAVRAARAVAAQVEASWLLG